MSEEYDNDIGKRDSQCDLPPFFDQARFWLDQTSPNWRTVLKAEFGHADTICIPDCLDLGSNKFYGPITPKATGYDKEEVKKAKSRIKGGSGEEQFLTEFRKLKLGGILVHGFYSQDFIKVIRDSSGLSGFKDLTEKWKNEKKHFECDFTFIHEQIGLVTIEIKACDGEREMAKRLHEASAQLQRIKSGLIELYERTVGQSVKFAIHRFVCMPSIHLENCKNSKVLDAIKVIDKTSMDNETQFMEFWKSIQHQDFPLTDNFIQFIAALVAYRPAKFISAPTNALEIYRRIDQQNFSNRKNDELQVIFYNKDQLNAIECKSNQVLISGPPGTGKTLCLLQRVLNASEIEKTGRVVVLLSEYVEELVPLFDNFFMANLSKLKRTPKVELIQDDDNLTQFTSDDDLFTDEFPHTISHNFEKAFPSRNLASGSSTVVITGWRYPSKIANVEEGQETRTVYANFEHFELRTVIRGTKTIIEKWQTHFPDRFLYVGHNITGAATEQFSVGSSSEMIEIVLCKLKQYLSPLPLIETFQRKYAEEKQSLQCSPHDIAVLVVCDYDSSSSTAIESTIRSIFAGLKENGFHCGWIEDQVRDAKLIAVDYSLSAISYEWPIVIVIAFENSKGDRDWYKTHPEPEYLIGASRAIAKLIIIDGVPLNRSHEDDEKAEKP